MAYRRRASPLHAARAAAGGLWCLALACAVLAAQHPAVLAVLAVVVLASATAARAGAEVRSALLLAAPIAALAALINPFVVRQGVTVLARLGEVPPFGEIDLTLEALVYGALLGVRIALVIGVFALFTAAVDPDGILRAFRRLSFRSALAAALAVRLVPVLARDGRRLSEARRTRGVPGPDGMRGRLALARAVATGALDRALDVAATLEVRGYASARRGRPARVPWSRHDMAFAASALALLAVSAGARLSGATGFDVYPLLDLDAGAAHALAAGTLAAVALAPFADRRGIEP